MESEITKIIHYEFGEHISINLIKILGVENVDHRMLKAHLK